MTRGREGHREDRPRGQPGARRESASALLPSFLPFQSPSGGREQSEKEKRGGRHPQLLRQQDRPPRGVAKVTQIPCPAQRVGETEEEGPLSGCPIFQGPHTGRASLSPLPGARYSVYVEPFYKHIVGGATQEGPRVAAAETDHPLTAVAAELWAR